MSQQGWEVHSLGRDRAGLGGLAVVCVAALWVLGLAWQVGGGVWAVLSVPAVCLLAVWTTRWFTPRPAGRDVQVVQVRWMVFAGFGLASLVAGVSGLGWAGVWAVTAPLLIAGAGLGLLLVPDGVSHVWGWLRRPRVRVLVAPRRAEVARASVTVVAVRGVGGVVETGSRHAGGHHLW